MRIPVPKRPSDVVLQYLEGELAKPGAKSSTRLPTIQTLAKHLGVSPSTIRAVYRQMAAEGRIEATPGRGTFLRKAPSARSTYHIGGLFGSPSPAMPLPWEDLIFVGAAQEAGQRGQFFSGLPQAPTDDRRARRKALLEMFARIDGILLLPGSTDAVVLDVLDELQKPSVRITAPTVTATENFVACDLYGFARALGAAWRKTGRKSLALLSPVKPSESPSAQAMIHGLNDGFGWDASHAVRLALIPGEDREREIERWLDSCGKIPDGILGFGDLMARDAVAALRRRGLDVPRHVSVVGGTGLPGEGSPLTTAGQPMRQMGAEAVRMLLRRLAHGGQPVPGLYLPCTFAGGSTTRPEENRLLAAARPPAASS